MTDLTTNYLGLNLKKPLVASASPLSKKLDNARKLEQAGIAAIVARSPAVSALGVTLGSKRAGPDATAISRQSPTSRSLASVL